MIDLTISRSPFGDFPVEQETVHVKEVISALHAAQIAGSHLLNKYRERVHDSNRIQVAKLVAESIDAGIPSPSLDLGGIIEVLYFVDLDQYLAAQHLLAPIYKLHASYDENSRVQSSTLITAPVSLASGVDRQWSVLGTSIGLPIGVGASPLTDRPGAVQALFSLGFNVITYRTVRSQEQTATDHPNWLYLSDYAKEWTLGDLTESRAHNRVARAETDNYVSPSRPDVSMANFLGVPSAPLTTWQHDLEDALASRATNQILIASVLGAEYEQAESDSALIRDFVHTAKQVEKVGAPIIELNLSCPNNLDSRRHPLCQSVTLTGDIVKAVRDSLDVKTRLVIKLSHMSQRKLGSLLFRVGALVDGVAAINAIQVPVENAQGKPIFAHAQAAISGHAIGKIARAFVTNLARERFKQGFTFHILGLGGVTDASSFEMMYRSGADIVQSVTGVNSNQLLALDCVRALGNTLPLHPPAPLTRAARKELDQQLVDSIRANPGISAYALSRYVALPVSQLIEVVENLSKSGAITIDGGTGQTDASSMSLIAV